MTKKKFAILAALLTFVVGVALARFSLPQLRSPSPPADRKELQLSNYRLSGPYQHENLTIYLVHGPNQQNSRMFTPLQDAMERNIVIVHETSNVNELSIENVSDSEEVFVQAGDIVKGGRQDRMLAVDLILPAQSGVIPIAAFCVEQSRWSQRDPHQSADHFTLTEMVATRDLKLAVKQAINQVQVWKKVEETQEKLSESVNAEVRASGSTTSLPLALENERVQESTAAYVGKLSTIVGGSTDVIGFVFSINNKLYNGDVYASNTMFTRFWPRLLKSAAIEAVAERVPRVTNEPVSIAAAGEFLVGSERGSETLQEVTPRTHMLKRDAEKSVYFETRDMDHEGALVHRNYLTK
ncbi:MAG TPA: DUF6569 family protein [Pyrinomonadaceae bacterium]|nr:DUF6569 family protein [Pyrinomonadaceae bacterium]